MPDPGLGAGAGSTLTRWTHPSVLLVATDMNDLGRLMPFAFEQAAETGARVILLHVLGSAAAMSTDGAGIPYYDSGGAVEEAARRRKIACYALVREGNAPRQIAEAVEELNADRILLGTRSRSKLSKLLLGSVAEQVLRSVNIPVFTVGPEAHLAAEDEGRERVVLYATTLKETSRPSAALACHLASERGATLLLLHVLPPIDEMERSGLPTGLDSAAMHELRHLAAETGAGCCTAVEPLVVHGNPSIEVLAQSSERRASLIVLGATQRSAVENLTRDRTIYRVLAHARCPVLTLREAQTSVGQADAERLATYG